MCSRYCASVSTLLVSITAVSHISFFFFSGCESRAPPGGLTAAGKSTHSTYSSTRSVVFFFLICSSFFAVHFIYTTAVLTFTLLLHFYPEIRCRPPLSLLVDLRVEFRVEFRSLTTWLTLTLLYAHPNVHRTRLRTEIGTIAFQFDDTHTHSFTYFVCFWKQIGAVSKYISYSGVSQSSNRRCCKEVMSQFRVVVVCECVGI